MQKICKHLGSYIYICIKILSIITLKIVATALQVLNP